MSQFERFDPSEESAWYGENKKSPYSLDYLYFFVGEKDFATKEVFEESYMSSLKENWAIAKSVTNENVLNYPNLWYEFTNSKVQFLHLGNKRSHAQLLLGLNAFEHKVILNPVSTDISDRKWYAKSEFGFAGRGNRIIAAPTELSDQTMVLEEYLDRVVDFAITFITPDQYIIYRNQVLANGQYQGTSINRKNCTSIEKFLADHEVGLAKIERFIKIFKEVTSYYQLQMNQSLRGSFDFFLYKKNSELFIHPGCEFNPRWTMGRVAWYIFQKHAPSNENFFDAQFSHQKLHGYQYLNPPGHKINYCVKWC